MQQSGGLLLDPGWTGSTPLFLPTAKMQTSLVTCSIKPLSFGSGFIFIHSEGPND